MIEISVPTPIKKFAQKHYLIFPGLLPIVVIILSPGIPSAWTQWSGKITGVTVARPIESVAVGTGGTDQSLSGEWYVSNERAVNYRDGFISLNKGYGAVRFEYSEDVTLLRNHISFVSRGEEAMNVEFARTGLYQVVIGDNSYKHIGFKHMTSTGEWGEYQRRAFENCNFKPGDVVGVYVSENFIQSENEFILDMVFICETPEGVRVRDELRYSFEAVPNMKELKNFYIGLIDTEESSNQTKAYFIDPDISNNIANS